MPTMDYQKYLKQIMSAKKQSIFLLVILSPWISKDQVFYGW